MQEVHIKFDEASDNVLIRIGDYGYVVTPKATDYLNYLSLIKNANARLEEQTR